MSHHHLQEFFYSLTPDKILAAVETSGVRCTGRLLQLGSFENRVYEVEVEFSSPPKNKADSFRIVKFYRPARWSKEQIIEEHEFLRELQAEDVPVVAPIVLQSGSSLGILPHLEGSSMFFAVFPKVQGRRPEELSDTDLKVMGRLLARMHLIGRRKLAIYRNTFDVGLSGLESLQFLRSGPFLPPILEGRYSSLVEAICQQSRADFLKIPNQRLHGDCHLGNVLQGQEGFFFLDFDDMVNGPPVQDMWLICGGRDEEGHRQRHIFLDAYEEFLSFDEGNLRLIEALRALRYVHYSAWIAKRWEDPIFPRTFPHFKAQDYWINQLQEFEEILELMSSV
ncbi:MAG: serine/threonine protein kinase [Oligoflexales bacterium]|nr:serine/threonine protein kinase [Oligoflexales bacterium]